MLSTEEATRPHEEPNTLQLIECEWLKSLQNMHTLDHGSQIKAGMKIEEEKNGYINTDLLDDCGDSTLVQTHSKLSRA